MQLGRSSGRHDCWFDPQAGHGQWEALHSPSDLWIHICLLSTRSYPRHNLKIEMCYCDYLDWVPDWTQLRPVYELGRFWWMGAKNLLVLRQPNTSLVNKFPCLLNLSPANPECPAFIFSLSLPCLSRDWFQITSQKLPNRFANNRCM